MNMVNEILQIISTIAGLIVTTIALIRPLRNRVLGLGKIQEGQKCLLRSKMLEIYFRNYTHKTLRQYEYENFMYLYEAYKALGGNSFIDKIKIEIENWKILP